MEYSSNRLPSNLYHLRISFGCSSVNKRIETVVVEPAVSRRVFSGLRFPKNSQLVSSINYRELRRKVLNDDYAHAHVSNSIDSFVEKVFSPLDSYSG